MTVRLRVHIESIQEEKTEAEYLGGSVTLRRLKVLSKEHRQVAFTDLYLKNR
jgi:hypothetical protein